MRLFFVLYGGNCQCMPTLQGRSGQNYGRLHWNQALRRHESTPFTIEQYRRMLPDIAETTTGERWLVDILVDVTEEVPTTPAAEPPISADPLSPEFSGSLPFDPASVIHTTNDAPPLTGISAFRALRKQCKDAGIEVTVNDNTESLKGKLAAAVPA